MDFIVLLFVAADFFFHMSLIDARSCFFPGEGEKKFYICTKNEYCCSYGCCLSPSFQFYQLWYYWLMVIFMFLLCSGGGWWYRYWLHERYPSEFTNSLHTHQVGRACPRPYRPARITYHPARETIILHHVWKGPDHAHIAAMRARSPPPYQPSDGSRIISNGVPLPSPYHQIYGPPPSYDCVVAGTSGAESPQALPPGVPVLHDSVSRILSGLVSKENAAQFFEAPPPVDAAGTSLYVTEPQKGWSTHNSTTTNTGDPPKYVAEYDASNRQVDHVKNSVGEENSPSTSDVCSAERSTADTEDQSYRTETNHRNQIIPNKLNRHFCNFDSFKSASSIPIDDSSSSSHRVTRSNSSSSLHRDNVFPTNSSPSFRSLGSIICSTENSSQETNVCTVSEAGPSCQSGSVRPASSSEHNEQS